MRTFDPQSALAQLRCPSAAAVAEVLRVSLPLRTITPVLGGGVLPFEPHPWEPVRVPAVRGQLRWWYRAMCPAAWSPDELLADETGLWGGVGTEDPVRSRVEVQVAVLNAGRVAPAGRHPWKEKDRKTAAFPTWTTGAGQNLAYGLFPLQMAEEDRKAWEREHKGQDMPTRSAREGLRFRLSLALRVASGDQVDPADRLRRLLRSLWAWTNLGGIGARTRRGFGALAVDGPVDIEGGDPAVAEARRWFEVRSLGEWQDLAPRVLAAPAERRPVHSLLVGPRQGSADLAHGQLVSLLQSFRQGRGTGREWGSGNRPGESHWPEAHALRVHRGASGYEHDPPASVAAAVRRGDQGFPRAAFGLPLEAGFKDAGDKQANASVLPDQVHIGDREVPMVEPRRFASPLLLRPLMLPDGAWPVIAVLGGESVESVRLRWKGQSDGGPQRLPVRQDSGALDPIKPYLRRSNGEALGAFCDWVQQHPNWQGPAPSRGGHR